jgi:NAD(P)-dependent dehydrogenase (short-subunit alcohol dehydrogenase family)
VSVEAAFAEVERRHGRLDVLYTCAAVQLIGEDGPVHELPVEVVGPNHAVNARGVFLTCKHGARLMVRAATAARSSTRARHRAHGLRRRMAGLLVVEGRR